MMKGVIRSTISHQQLQPTGPPYLAHHSALVLKVASPSFSEAPGPPETSQSLHPLLLKLPFFGVHVHSIRLDMLYAQPQNDASCVGRFLQIFKLWHLCSRCCGSIAEDLIKHGIFLQLVLHKSTQKRSEGHTNTYT